MSLALRKISPTPTLVDEDMTFLMMVEMVWTAPLLGVLPNLVGFIDRNNCPPTPLIRRRHRCGCVGPYRCQITRGLHQSGLIHSSAFG